MIDDGTDPTDPPSPKVVAALLREARSVWRRADKLGADIAAVPDPTIQQLAAQASSSIEQLVHELMLLESWTVLGDDDIPVAPIERYLAYLTDIERSPNTIKAYAHDLKDWFVFLTGRGLDWREVRLEDIAGFIAWLRRPPATRDGAVAILPSVEHHCAESTVNRKLSALSAFYQHACRHGVDLGELLTTWQLGGSPGLGVEAVPASHRQGAVAASARDRADGAAQAAACAVGCRGAGHPGCL